MKKPEEFKADLELASGSRNTKADIIIVANAILAAYKERFEAVNNDVVVVGLNKDITGLNETVSSLKLQLTSVTEERDAAKAVAEEATSQFNEQASLLPKKVTAKISGYTYEILYGVDGLTKEELAKEKDKLEVMLEKGSGALVKLEGK